MPEDLEVLLLPYLWAVGRSDSYVYATRRDDLPDDNEHWLSVLGFVREHGLALHETGAAPDTPTPPGTHAQRWIWTAPELQVDYDELAADVRRRLGSSLLADDLRLPWE